MSHGFGCHLSGSKIQIAFLGETKRTIPRSRPASGRAVAHRSCPGCRLRHRRAAPARPGRDRARLYACPGWAISIVENSDAKSRASGDTRRSNELVECHSEPTRGRSPVSPDRPTKISCCEDQLNPPNTPRSSSASAVVRQVCDPRWVRSAMPMTTPCARASLASTLVVEFGLQPQRRFAV